MVGLCRLCASLRKISVLITIKDDSSEICEKLRRCCALNITMSDALPKSICPECLENLNNSHKFYIKVKEAQETLQSLYPINSSVHSEQESLEQTLLELKEESTKQKQFIVKLNKPKVNSDDDKLIPETLLKQVSTVNKSKQESENFVKESQTDENITKVKEISGNLAQRIFNTRITDVDKSNTSSTVSYEIIEVVEENIELVKNEDFLNEEKEQLLKKEQSNDRQYLIVSNDDDIESHEVIKQINNISENEHVEVEYTEYYDDEEEGDEITNVEIKQVVTDNPEIVDLQPVAAHIKLNSWKKYIYLCFKCDETLSNFMELKSHIEQSHTITPDKLLYKCYDCRKIIPRYNFFLNHVRSKHHSDLKLRCDVCDLICQDFEELSHHRSFDCVDAKNYADIVPCSQCFKSFHSIFGLQNHCKFQHDFSKTKVKYKCGQCDKEFQYKSCLKSHKQLHTDTKKVSCLYCDKSFHNKVSLEQHLYTHVDEKKYQCHICSKSYKTYKILAEHQKLHSDEKPFKCEFCDKRFVQNIQKQTHERSHTGEMPYLCQQCDKRFRYRSAFISHCKIHSGVKPYSCKYCDKTFADRSNRNKHVKRMHAMGEDKKENIRK